MQSAKDTFYVMLQQRIATLNPARTLVLRELSRSGVLVVENELVTSLLAADAFWLRWFDLAMDSSDKLVRMRCEISYATDGMIGAGGMDRGRLLAGMDAELATALQLAPQNAVKSAYSAAGVTVMSTNIFWTDPVFGKTAESGERLSRASTVEVFAYQEAEEL